MCSLSRHGRTCVLTFLGHGEHRFSPASIAAIIEALHSLRGSDAAALITTNQGNYFSNGLDLSWLNADPNARRSPLAASFSRLVLSFLRLPMLTIAAVAGHASAGGFIFALAHDYIFMRKDRGFLYMSEIDIGMLIPPPHMALIRYKMPPLAFKLAVLGGQKLTADRALSLGIVDSAHENSGETLQEALKYAANLVGKKAEGSFYQQMRAAMYPNIIEQLETDSSAAESLKIGLTARM